MTKKLEEDLGTCLKSNGVCDEIDTYLVSKGCLTVNKFACWVDTGKELKAIIIDKVKDIDAEEQLASLKMAWRQAEAKVSRAFKRQAEGLSDEVIDEPLGTDVQQLVKTSFQN